MFDIFDFLAVFGVLFVIFFLLFVRGASKLNRQYDREMRKALEDETMA